MMTLTRIFFQYPSWCELVHDTTEAFRLRRAGNANSSGGAKFAPPNCSVYKKNPNCYRVNQRRTLLGTLSIRWALSFGIFDLFVGASDLFENSRCIFRNTEARWTSPLSIVSDFRLFWAGLRCHIDVQIRYGCHKINPYRCIPPATPWTWPVFIDEAEFILLSYTYGALGI